MSGGSSISGSRLIANVYDPANIMGKSGSSVGGNILDPGGWWGINKEGAMTRKSQDPDAAGGPDELPRLPGNYAPFLYDPGSFAARPAEQGYYNNIAAQLAGPMYVPRLLPRSTAQPAVRPAVQIATPGAGYAGWLNGISPVVSQLIRKVQP